MKVLLLNSGGYADLEVEGGLFPVEVEAYPFHEFYSVQGAELRTLGFEHAESTLYTFFDVDVETV